jgi:hypothetical protein
MEQRAFFYGKEGVSRRNRFRRMSLLELRLEPVAEYSSNALKWADRAARMDTLDWQALRQVEDGGIDVVPAEVAPLQILAEALQVRLRFQLARHQFGDAIGTATTMFALGRHLGEHPDEVAALVGLGAAHLALDEPGGDGAAVRLPESVLGTHRPAVPLVDLRKSMQGHRLRVAAELRPIRDDGPMTDAEIEAFVRHLSGVLGFARERAGLPPAPCGPASKRGSRIKRRWQPPASVSSRPAMGQSSSINSNPRRPSCWTRSVSTPSATTTSPGS